MQTFALFQLCVLLSFFVALCVCDRVLVLLSDVDQQSRTHSQLIAELKRHFSVDVTNIDDKQLRLQDWGSWLYDGVFILSDSDAAFGGAVDSAYLVDFFDSGRNVFIAAGAKAPLAVRELAAELGADYLDEGVRIKDYISYSASQGPESLLTSVVSNVKSITGTVDAPILYEGTALTMPADATLTYGIVKAEFTATAPRTVAAGNDLCLAIAGQSRGNARSVVLASTAALSDEAFDAFVTNAATGSASSTGNLALAKQLVQWAFKRTAVLHMSNFTHHRASEAQPPIGNTYTVNDEITVELDLFESKDGQLVPHVSDQVQIQYCMLDPHVRKNMRHDGQGHYSLTFKAPDVYGVFKWVVDYRRPGYTSVHMEEVAPLRPFRHNEFPRFIVQAYPYYATLMVLSAGFLVTIRYVMYLE